MSIADYVLDDSVTVVGSGRGWSIWREEATGRTRFDVVSGKAQKCVPMITKDGITSDKARSACHTLWSNAFFDESLVAPVRNLRRFCENTWPA